ncbi:type I pantothenate kinase [Dysgonomonas sp. PH5-45]|uniref:type I pantothenate kinase n=1 Tax=unclassified Dysgonomonas TaxID=2630389 RepID=UPI002474A89B|nr:MULTISPECIES: type I pantothenate kinase [unclassified Dysgonomonas]MDH6355269.1 type I pantothenate kinase [Dysgonomonas sp. PH5-45]MDH6388205.1 type I pantothenate kinase [Dysgonomonas sp. PH5-37]
MNNKVPASPYMSFSRQKWAALRDSEPLTLTEGELATLKGINEEISIGDVEDIYLPLSRLLNYYVNATTSRQAAIMNFLSEENKKIPFIISIAGSVSAGKSTAARVLQALLSRWKEHTKVALVTTDGFLYPNDVLEEKGLMLKKGFPQSYNIQRLLQFMVDVKSGNSSVKAPIYSHLVYDIVPDEYEEINQPDILILEGLNVLQSGMDYPHDKPRVFVSDFVDFSIYVDAEEEMLEDWYVSRFLKFREGAFANPQSYFHSYTKLTESEATKMAKTIWREINRKNLRRNILPTRERASLIIHKGKEHVIDYVRLRR